MVIGNLAAFRAAFGAFRNLCGAGRALHQQSSVGFWHVSRPLFRSHGRRRAAPLGLSRARAHDRRGRGFRFREVEATRAGPGVRGKRIAAMGTFLFVQVNPRRGGSTASGSV
jgi:hypothetical protein